MFNVDWKKLIKWEKGNKSRCFLVVTEEYVREMFTSEEIKDVDIYECIQEVWYDYDLSEEYQHIMDTIHERVEEKIKEKKDEKRTIKN
tara:strand:+ start:398 stop:661 length:264 start_codon:yes stop_codon:yes gene_type:complete